MSSKDKNLDATTYKGNAAADTYKIGVVVSEWNAEITDALYEGCVDALKKFGVVETHIVKALVPGSFELPLGAKLLAGSQKFDAIICLGCVIRGETRHDEYINSAVSSGLMNLSLVLGIPVVFGVLTPENMQQALDRAGGKHGNKGIEAAHTALKMIALRDSYKNQKSAIGF